MNLSFSIYKNLTIILFVVLFSACEKQVFEQATNSQAQIETVLLKKENTNNHSKKIISSKESNQFKINIDQQNCAFEITSIESEFLDALLLVENDFLTIVVNENFFRTIIGADEADLRTIITRDEADFRTIIGGDCEGLRTIITGDDTGFRTIIGNDDMGFRTIIGDDIAGIGTVIGEGDCSGFATLNIGFNNQTNHTVKSLTQSGFKNIYGLNSNGELLSLVEIN